MVGFYVVVIIALFFIWRERGLLAAGQKKLLAIAAVSVVSNLSFALCWQPSDMERYLPSIGLLIMGMALAVDGIFIQSKKGLVIGLLAIGTVACVNWFGTFHPLLASDSYKQDWLSQTRLHTNGKDLLIVLGNRKFELVDPHNPNAPRILNISRVVAMGRVELWREIVLEWIQEARQQRGRVMIGDSVLGLDSGPRDGWSFAEWPTPSPRDLDNFFAPMKGRLIFTSCGERVWLSKN
jgi:hypothetical protein